MRTSRHLPLPLALLTAGTLALSGCGGGFSDTSSDGSESPEGLQVLIGSAMPAELKAVTDAVAAWSASSGTEARVAAAQNLNQQLSQGFAAKAPPDVFYVGAEEFNSYAANGSLEPYGDDLPDKGDFYPALTDAFTRDGELYCAPKDFSTLALVINERLWDEAGLTDADVPTTWEQLSDVAQRLTGDGVTGLSTSSEFARMGAFMAQAGGGLVTDGEATVDSEPNVEALTFVRSMLDDGSMAFAQDVGAGWGGEAFGTEKTAMTIEGNWLVGAMDVDYPDVGYRVVPLPAGPAGEGTLSFTNCWGIAADSTRKAEALALVEYLITPEQQIEFTRGFGVMPSVTTAREQFISEFPEQAAFVAGADDAVTLPNQEGVTDVIADLNAKLENLKGEDPAAILTAEQPLMVTALEG